MTTTAHAAVSAQTGAVTVTDEDIITFSNRGSLVVISVMNTEAVWVRFDGVTPVRDADNCFLVLGRGARTFKYQGPVVRVVGDSATAAEYTVEIQP